jgi:pectate lyase
VFHKNRIFLLALQLCTASWAHANGAQPPTTPPPPGGNPPVEDPVTNCAAPPPVRNCLSNVAQVCQADLLSELEGFAKNVSGGQGGEIYSITSLDDNPSSPAKGTLRHAVKSSGKKWIVFKVSGTLNLKDKLVVSSDKTLDGRGAKVLIRGATVDIPKTTKNVIISDLSFRDSYTGSGDGEGFDAIGISDGARGVWIHHVLVANSGDGLIDMKRGATDITISWTRLTEKPNKAMLITATDDKKPGKVTLHHNHWLKGDDRQPKIDGYQVHIYNNYYDQSERGVDITCYNKCQVFVEANVWNPLSSNENKLGVDKSSDRVGYARTEGNYLKRGITLDTHMPEKVFQPRDSYTYTADKAGEDLACRVKKFAGPRG